MCSKCNREILVDLGRQVIYCGYHDDLWCSCKVRQFISLLGLHELEENEDGTEVRYVSDWFPKAGDVIQ